MDPTIWGKCLWKSLHVVALGYPSEPTLDDRESYKYFFENFWKVLPCKKPCSQNYKRHLEELPIQPYLSNTDRLFEWTVILHNVVNKEVGKKEISIKEAREDILVPVKNKNNTTTMNNLYYLWILIFIIVSLLIYILTLHFSNKK